MITLGIIGVVAAMTLPTLIQNHQKQTYVTALKKAYSNLQNAFAQMAADEDVTEWRQTVCSNLGLYYAIENEYGGNIETTDTSANCVNKLQKIFNAINKEGAFNNNGLVLTTSDGMKYTFYRSPNCHGSFGYNVVCSLVIRRIYVDINGDKGPNKWGRDKFRFEVNNDKNKIEPLGLSSYQTLCTPEMLKSSEYNAQYCTAKVLIEGKMDY